MVVVVAVVQQQMVVVVVLVKESEFSFVFFVFFQLLETSRAGQTETFRPVNGSKSTRLTSRFKALGFESHRLKKQWERPQI